MQVVLIWFLPYILDINASGANMVPALQITDINASGANMVPALQITDINSSGANMVPALHIRHKCKWC
jgi:hypothetical protein